MTRPVFRARSTSHTVAAHDGCTKIPLAAHRAQEDENHSRKRLLSYGLLRFVYLDPPGLIRSRKMTEFGKSVSSSGRHRGTFDHDTGGYIFPERDEQFSRQRHDCRLTQAAAITADSFVEPKGKRRVRLIAQPQPGELDQCCSQSRISGFGQSLFPIDRSTLPGCRRQARISGDLTSVVEVAEKPFRPKYGGELRTNTFNIQQHRRWHRRGGTRRDQQCVPLGLHGFDLLEKSSSRSISRLICALRCWGKGRPSPVRSSSSRSCRSRRSGSYPETPWQNNSPLMRLTCKTSLGGQHSALAAEAAAVLLLGSGHLDHRTHPRFAAFVGQKRADQRLAVDLVGLRPPPPARCGNRGRVDNVAFDLFALQHAMDPEAVQAGLLDCDDGEVPPRKRLPGWPVTALPAR